MEPDELAKCLSRRAHAENAHRICPRDGELRWDGARDSLCASSRIRVDAHPPLRYLSRALIGKESGPWAISCSVWFSFSACIQSRSSLRPGATESLGGWAMPGGGSIR